MPSPSPPPWPAPRARRATSWACSPRRARSPSSRAPSSSTSCATTSPRASRSAAFEGEAWQERRADWDGWRGRGKPPSFASSSGFSSPGWWCGNGGLQEGRRAGASCTSCRRAATGCSSPCCPPPTSTSDGSRSLARRCGARRWCPPRPPSLFSVASERYFSAGACCMGPSSGGAIAEQLCGGGMLRSRFTHVVWSPFAVKLQPPPPLHAPPQPTNVELASGTTVSEMRVPAATVIVHTAGQSIPAGVEVTRPDPLPIGTTSMRAVPGGRVEKFAVTSRSTSMVSAHPAVPEQAPCHPTKVEPLAGTAVSRTAVRDRAPTTGRTRIQANDSPPARERPRCAGARPGRGGARSRRAARSLPPSRARRAAARRDPAQPPPAAEPATQSPRRAGPPSLPPVSIFEAHHVFELRRARLQDVAIAERDHAVHHPCPDADRLARAQLHLAPPFAAVVLESHRPREQMDGFVFLPVVLEAEGVYRGDVENLSYVSLRMRPDELVAPRLLHPPRGVTHVTGNDLGCFRHAPTVRTGRGPRQGG